MKNKNSNVDTYIVPIDCKQNEHVCRLNFDGWLQWQDVAQNRKDLPPHSLEETTKKEAQESEKKNTQNGFFVLFKQQQEK